MCELSGLRTLHYVPGLIEILGAGSDEEFDKLSDHVEGCPACILAAIRQSRLHESGPNGYVRNPGGKVNCFDFKAETGSFFSERENNREPCCGYDF